MITSTGRDSPVELGRPEDIRFLLFDALLDGGPRPVKDVQRYCSDNIYGVGPRFSGLLSILMSVGAIALDEGFLRLTPWGIDLTKLGPDRIFDEPTFYDSLFRHLSKDGDLPSLFPNLQIVRDGDRQLILLRRSSIPKKLLPTLKLLLETGFLSPSIGDLSGIHISKGFSAYFLSKVVDLIDSAVLSHGMSIDDLTKLQDAQTQAGQRAEEAVLRFEFDRLVEHPKRSNVRRVFAQQRIGWIRYPIICKSAVHYARSVH